MREKSIREYVVKVATVLVAGTDSRCGNGEGDGRLKIPPDHACQSRRKVRRECGTIKERAGVREPRV